MVPHFHKIRQNRVEHLRCQQLGLVKNELLWHTDFELRLLSIRLCFFDISCLVFVGMDVISLSSYVSRTE